MSDRPTARAAAAETIAKLAQPPRTSDLHPIAGRFVYALRLIAVHEKARRDPVPELTMRLGGVELAARALALAQVIKESWPENVHVGRYCCSLLSHDEVTVGALLGSALRRDRAGFEGAIDGFVRAEGAHQLWDAVLAFVAAELRAV